MGPKILVLSGAEAVERALRLINAMVNRPPNLDQFGRVLVDLMAHPHADLSLQAAIIQPLVRPYLLDQKDFPTEQDFDPGFDQRIMMEAAVYSAKSFAKAFEYQAPALRIEDYQFNRWLNTDLVLERRGSL